MGLIGNKLPILNLVRRESAYSRQSFDVCFAAKDISCKASLSIVSVSRHTRLICLYCFPSQSCRPTPFGVRSVLLFTWLDCVFLLKYCEYVSKRLVQCNVLRKLAHYKEASREFSSCVKHFWFLQSQLFLRCQAALIMISNVGLLALPLVRLLQMQWESIRLLAQPQVVQWGQYATTTAAFVTDIIRPSGRIHTLNRRAGFGACAAVLHVKDC